MLSVPENEDWCSALSFMKPELNFPEAEQLCSGSPGQMLEIFTKASIEKKTRIILFEGVPIGYRSHCLHGSSIACRLQTE